MIELLQGVADFFQAVTESGLLWVGAVYVLVWLLGEAGLKGKVQLASSFAVGLIIGILVRMGEVGLQMDFQEWMNTAFYGILLGGLASGGHEAIKQLVTKVASQTLSFPDNRSW